MNVKALLQDPQIIIRRRGEILPRLYDAGRRVGYRMGLIGDQNGRAIHALKDLYRGRRAFIIGNGPSLEYKDLELIRNELSFASNRIYLAFAHTSWRPSYYSVCDKLVAERDHERINALPLRKVFSRSVKEYFAGAGDVIWLHDATHNLRAARDLEQGEEGVNFRFSGDLLQGCEGGWTVTYQQLQMAYYMGIEEVVFIGLDFSFSVPSGRIDTGVRGYGVQLQSEGEANHFHPEYRKKGEAWSVPKMDCMEMAYRSAMREYTKAGRRIVNASRKSELRVFPKVVLEEVLR